MSGAQEPSYVLVEIKAKVAAGFFVITESSFQDAGAMGLSRLDIEACIAQLDESDFYKTMPSNARPGLMHDVYRPIYCDEPVYLKLQLNQASRAVVISFKRDQSFKRGQSR